MGDFTVYSLLGTANQPTGGYSIVEKTTSKKPIRLCRYIMISRPKKNFKKAGRSDLAELQSLTVTLQKTSHTFQT
jgi:hypothetical protein